MTNRCIIGDCRDVMRDLIAQGVKVQMCVTSPPYWGLRDYGTAEWEGGDPECEHRKPATGGTQNKGNNNREGSPMRELCELCGARRVDRQLGIESTPQEYVANMVEVFRLVRELLADDGTLWLNLGDSYAGGEMAPPGTEKQRSNRGATAGTGVDKSGSGLRAKNLCGIPWRVAFALQADGWYLRQDIIWSKPNPMPESVRDRCTKSHEYLFLLAKNERYYYDRASIAEVADTAGDIGGFTGYQATAMNRPASGNQIPEKGRAYIRPETRNKRSVWTVTTKPYSEAHFATFPPDLIEPCILAGSRPGDIVLDPFFGSGTTGEVAQRLGRQWVGIELNAAYELLQQRRTAQQGMVLL